RDAIRRHLALISGACHRVLSCAAVIGRDFNVQLLASAAREEIPEIHRLLDEAAKARLLSPASEVPGTYRFIHGLVSDVLYAELPAAERAELHGKIGRILEGAPEAEQVLLLEQVSHHFFHAVPLYAANAVKFSLLAAQKAMDQLAYERAIFYYDRALQLLDAN